MTDDEEREAAELVAFGMFLQGQRLDEEPGPAEAASESPGPRAPRPDPSQGSSVIATADPSALFEQAIQQPARGDGGWRPIH